MNRRSNTMRVTSRSHVGGRTDNEDVTGHFEPVSGEWVGLLADGLGGHGAGLLAATIVVKSLTESLHGLSVDRDTLSGHLELANGAVLRGQQASPGLYNMRATVVLLHLASTGNHTTAVWAHCGDSRLYHIRAGELLARTKDHSVAQMLVNDGELGSMELRTHPDRHRLTRSVGGGVHEFMPRVLPAPVDVEPGDAFLLCSDGWWENLHDAEIVEPSGGEPDSWLDGMERLIRERCAADQDNYSAIGVVV